MDWMEAYVTAGLKKGAGAKAINRVYNTHRLCETAHEVSEEVESDAHKYLLVVERPEYREYQHDKEHGESKRSIFRIRVGNKILAVEPTVPGSQAAARVAEVEVDADLRDDRRDRECQDRVHAEHKKWRRPLPPATQIHDPIAQRKEQHTETAREQRIGAGP